MTKILIASSLLLIGAPGLKAAEAVDNWTHHCAACHGKDGAGKTRAGRMAGVKDMTDPQFQKSFTDAQAFQQIKNGLKNKDGTDKMKAFGDIFSDSEINALVVYVRSLQK